MSGTSSSCAKCDADMGMVMCGSPMVLYCNKCYPWSIQDVGWPRYNEEQFGTLSPENNPLNLELEQKTVMWGDTPCDYWTRKK